MLYHKFNLKNCLPHPSIRYGMFNSLAPLIVASKYYLCYIINDIHIISVGAAMETSSIS